MYRALVKRADEATSLVDTLVERFFGNSKGVLALSILEDARLSTKDYARLRELLERRKKSQ